MQVAKADNQKHLINGSGNTTDIIAAILHADKLCSSYTTNLAKTLSKKTVKDTCQAIYNFVTDNIEYKEDPDGLQFIQSPGHLFWGADGKGNGKGDCKSMSIFCASVLQNLGIKYAYRFISESQSNDYHHVFIVVPDEKGETVILDCVDDAFNIPHNFAKVKDIAAGPTASAGKIAGFGDPAPYDPNFVCNPQDLGYYMCRDAQSFVQNPYGFPVKSWDEYLQKWKDTILKEENTLATNLVDKIKKDTPYIVIDLGASEIRRTKFNAFAKGVITSAHQLLYSYWDENQATFPADIKSKQDQSKDFKKSILEHNYNRRVQPLGGTFGEALFTEEYLYKWADIDCYRVYGLPIAMLLQKAYNKINIGSDSIPVQGTPYFDLKQNRWIPNGMPADQFASLDGCLPYNGIRFYPPGTPYWSNSAFLIKNRATESTLKKWLLANPMPQIMVDAIKTDYPDVNAYNQSNAYYNAWFEKNVLSTLYGLEQKLGLGKKGLATFADPKAAKFESATGVLPDKPTINPQNTLNWIRANGGIPIHHISGKSSHIGSAGISVIVSAVVGAVIALASFIYGIIKSEQDKKKTEEQVSKDISDYPKDIANSYQTAEGCYMEAHNINGQIVYKKVCPDGTITVGADPNAPENIPGYIDGASIFGDPNTTQGKLKRVLIGAALAFGVYKIIS